MSRTYRRKNVYNEKIYVDSWFEDFKDNLEFLFLCQKRERSLKNLKSKRAWFHSDNYKPISTNDLNMLKSFSKERYRSKHNNNLKKLKFLKDYEDFKECKYKYYKNHIKNYIF